MRQRMWGNEGATKTKCTLIILCYSSLFLNEAALFSSMNVKVMSKNTEARVLPGQIQQQKTELSQINSHNKKIRFKKRYTGVINFKVLTIRCFPVSFPFHFLNTIRRWWKENTTQRRLIAQTSLTVYRNKTYNIFDLWSLRESYYLDESRCHNRALFHPHLTQALTLFRSCLHY